MRFFKKVFKISSYIFITLLVIFLVLVHIVFQPKTDEDILEEIPGVSLKHKEYKGFQYRLIFNRKQIDTTLPTLIFVHGSPGSLLDFKEYFKDETLKEKANMVSYERIGYGIQNSGNVQNINYEIDMLNFLMRDYDHTKTILVGYSYGGPIALGSKKHYKKVVLLAPSVFSEVEPMFWFLKFYEWKATRWIMPRILRGASKEKLQHANDLRLYEENWHTTPANVVSVHGDKDWIVPYSNSEYLDSKFSSEKFDLITVEGAGHGFIWSQFDTIKNELLNVINATDEE